MSKYSFRIPVRSREIFYRFIRCSITYRQWLARLHGSSRDRGSQRRANYTMFRVTRCGSRGGCPFRIRWQPEGGGRRKANPEFLLSFPSQFYRARNRRTANQPTIFLLDSILVFFAGQKFGPFGSDEITGCGKRGWRGTWVRSNRILVEPCNL